jgi:hypothetical protein
LRFERQQNRRGWQGTCLLTLVNLIIAEKYFEYMCTYRYRQELTADTIRNGLYYHLERAHRAKEPGANRVIGEIGKQHVFNGIHKCRSVTNIFNF